MEEASSINWARTIPVIITIIGNVCVFVSLPMHLLLFKALWQLRNTLNTSFYVLVRHISALSGMCVIIRLIVEFPATSGPIAQLIGSLGSNFLINIIGYIIDMGSVQFGMSITSIHTITAVNRLFAIIFAKKYQKLMTAAGATRLCLLMTFFGLIFRLPCLKIQFTQFHSTDGSNKTFYTLKDQSVNKYFASVAVGHGALCIIIIYTCYIAIAIRVAYYNAFHIKSIQDSVKRATVAAVISVLGVVGAITLLTTQQISWYGFGHDLMPYDWYLAVNGIFTCYNLAVHPWCLMIIFPNIRQQMFSFTPYYSNSNSSVQDVTRDNIHN